MKFRDEHFNDLYEFMKRMDASDDYLMIQVSALNPGKNGMELSLSVTGMEAGENGASRIHTEAALVTAMMRNANLKQLVTDAARHCEQIEELQRRQKS